MAEYLDMEAMNIKPNIFGLPTDAIQNIFNYLRIEQKSLAEGAVKESQAYNRFKTIQEENIQGLTELGQTVNQNSIDEMERQFIQQQSPINIPYQIALRYFRDLARRRGHDIN